MGVEPQDHALANQQVDFAPLAPRRAGPFRRRRTAGRRYLDEYEFALGLRLLERLGQRDIVKRGAEAVAVVREERRSCSKQAECGAGARPHARIPSASREGNR